MGYGITTPATRLHISNNGLSGTGGANITLDENPSAPPNTASDRVVIYAQDNGAGKTQLMAKFSSGAAVQIAIQP